MALKSSEDLLPPLSAAWMPQSSETLQKNKHRAYLRNTYAASQMIKGALERNQSVTQVYVMPSYLTLTDPSMLRTDAFRSMCRISYCSLTCLTDVTLQSFTHALFCLAANPQYVQPLREEVDAIIQKEGRSKASLAKMRK